MGIFRMNERQRLQLIKQIDSLRKEIEGRLIPLDRISPENPATFISVGGGELGDLAVTASVRNYGGARGGIVSVAFDKYHGFPAQDTADYSEVFDMMDGGRLEEAIKRYVPDPRAPHAIYLEVERIDTQRAYKLGMEEGYRIMSTPYGPLVCMDRHATKLMFDRLGLKMTPWAYASSQKGVEEAAEEFGLPVIVKPVMTSSGHGTSIAKTEKELKESYRHSVEHARGVGDEVIVEKYMPEVKDIGTEVTQIVVRHFNTEGRIVSTCLPPIEHRRPGATYHESWMPATISSTAASKCRDGAMKIADFMGGIGIYAVEQFVIGDEVYNNEVANRPHDTGLVTRWMLNKDEGALQLASTLGMPVSPSQVDFSRQGVYGVAHVVLAPEGIKDGTSVQEFSLRGLHAEIPEGTRWDLWIFGKPNAYAGRRMGLAFAYAPDLEKARKDAEAVAHAAEKRFVYKG
ncbi:MAG: ATP-grasp domain-containing protein [Candidatus Verstraetearchaeota archaeon]|nr:ATP-grasp domain-containing protein [Candidatus Verstraetearchaeota archaeon]